MNFSENLKKIRKENNLSQEQLADKLSVSRQSVSKWESGSAYPEMDKMLKLCEMFDLGIDELLNQDVESINKNKDNKNNFNKYLDAFLDFITKIVNLFSNIKVKERIKCLIEQFVIVTILLIIFIVFRNTILDMIIRIIYLLPNNISNILFTIINTIFDIIAFILIVIIVIHTFKVRYLDYYEIVEKEETNEEESKESTKDVEKQIPKREKIIIRDPEHSGYKVITCLAKGVLLMIKLLALGTALGATATLIGCCICLVVSFLCIGTGFIFLGCLLSLLSVITINIIILIFLYNFIMDISSKKRLLGLILICSILVFGIGLGLIPLGVSKFDIITDFDSRYFKTETEFIPMKDNLLILATYGVEYVEENIPNIKIEKVHSNYYNVQTTNNIDDSISFHLVPNKGEKEMFDLYLKDINDKKIVKYDDYKIIIHASKENIEKLMNNFNKTYE